MSPITNQQIFELLQEVKLQNAIIRTDIATIKIDVGKISNRIQDLEDKVSELECENSNLKKKVKYLEETAKKNQIVVFGIKEEVGEYLERNILHLFSHTLTVDLHPQDIDNLYRVGSKNGPNPRPIIIKFVRHLTKQQIFQNVRKLKGTNISIAHDLTPEQLHDQKTLYKFYKIAKNKNLPTKIVKNQLIVNGETFSIADLKEAHEESFTEFFINKKRLYPNSSAPTTPSTQNQSATEITVSDEETPESNKNEEKSKVAENSGKPEDRSKEATTPNVLRFTRRGGRLNSNSGTVRNVEKTTKK